MVAGPVGLPGHRVLGAEGLVVVPALTPTLRMGDSTVSENQLRRPTAKMKSCNT